MQNGRIGPPDEVDATHCASRQIARFGCKEGGKYDLERLVAQKADALARVQLDDIERRVLETETIPDDGEVVRKSWHDLDKSLVIVAEWADVLSATCGFQTRVEITQGC